MADTAIEKKEPTAVAQHDDAADVTFTPRVDILETDDEMLLMVDLPGVKPEEVDVRFENGELSLHGRRSAKHSGRPWLWEYETGSFHRAFRVTENIAADKIHADMKNGVMTLHLPKVESVKPRRIAIKAN
jgi:HSP20 family protein